MSSRNTKNPLAIRLTESVVFLRGSSDVGPGRRRPDVVDAPPAMLRGLLVLELSKPTRVSSIELELDGRSSVQWPEGVGARRVEIPEEHKILSARTVFFSAKTCASSTRRASLGPGSHGFDEEEEDEFNEESRSTTPRSSRFARFSLDPSTLTSSRPGVNLISSSRASRRNSADQYGWQRNPMGQYTAVTFSPNRLSTPTASPPYTPERVASPLPAEITVSRSQTPTEPLPESPMHRRRNRKSLRPEDNPGQMLEEFRNALRMGMNNVMRPSASRMPSSTASQMYDPTDSPASSLRSVPGNSPRSESVPGSRSPSRDVENRHSRPASFSVHTHGVSSGRTASPILSSSTPPASVRNLSPYHAALQSPGTHEPEKEQSLPRGRRASSRWSLSSLSSVLKDVAAKVRSRSPKDSEARLGTPESHVANGAEPRVDFVIGQDDAENKRRERERKNALGKLTGGVRTEQPAGVEGWKEFKKGTYTYPISFAIPSTTPPTLHCDFGSIVYRLKAVVHRPGALTTRFSVSKEVTLVGSPADDDSEETHSIIVERQWDAQLRYLIALSGRSFAIGGQVPFNLTMVPLEKCKVYRLSVFLEEKTEYFTRSRQGAREQPVRRFELLSIRHPDKNAPPILPLSPDGSSASLLTPYLDTSALTSTTDEALSSLMGPGPWVLNHDLQLPAECGRIHFTYKHKTADITVSHTLKIVFRVERGDDQCLDLKTGKRRLFDIVVQTPIHILSCHCNPEWTALPRYSLFEGISDHPRGDPGPVCACSGGPARLSMLARYQRSPASNVSTSRPKTGDRRSSGSSNAMGIMGAERGSPAELADDSLQFARLVSGQEGVLGDAPPQYRDVPPQRQ